MHLSFCKWHLMWMRCISLLVVVRSWQPGIGASLPWSRRPRRQGSCLARPAARCASYRHTILMRQPSPLHARHAWS